jgi:hypothetical protein
MWYDRSSGIILSNVLVLNTFFVLNNSYMSLVAREMITGEEKDIVNLLEVVFQGWPHFDLECSSLDHWQWKYMDDILRSSLVVVCEKDHQIVGCHHTGYLRIKIGDNVWLCAQAMDLATHPAYRKIGVNTEICRIGEELIKSGKNSANYTYWVTTNPIVININKKTGNPVFPRPVSYLISVKDVSSHMKTRSVKNKFFFKMGIYGLKFLNKIFSPKHKATSVDFKIIYLDKFDEGFDLFWEKISGEYDYIIEKSSKYLNWRYGDKRGGNYRISVALDGDEILGYLVSRVNWHKPDYPEGFLVDFLALPGRADVLFSLMDDAITYFADLNVNVIHSWIIRGHPYEKVFFSYGFIDSRLEVNVSYNTRNDFVAPDQFLKASPSRLHFTYGSTDWI